ncbi:MAG: hypothetical protein ABEJ68_08430 [Halobacteriaceae archaeon]
MSLENRLRRWLESGEKLTFRVAAKLVFLFVLVMLAVMSFSANFWLTAVVSALLVGLMIRSVIPDQRFQSWARSYWTGEAGDRWRRRVDRWQSRLWGWFS